MLFEDGSGTLLDMAQDALRLFWLFGQSINIWGG